MQKTVLLLGSVLLFLLQACKKDDPDFLLPPPVPDQSFVEEFDTVSMAFQRGWVPVNNSNPKGSSIWMQGGAPFPIFEPWSSNGAYAGFIATDYLSTSGSDDVISNWLISPLLTMQNGDKLSFYTRAQLYPNAFSATDSTDYGNGLEVCANFKNESTDVGIAHDPSDPSYDAATDRGDFTLLLSINPASFDNSLGYWYHAAAHTDPALQEPGAYPSEWTRFEVTINGLSKPHTGRFAFRYYTLDGGASGNGSAVAIDQVVYTGIK